MSSRCRSGALALAACLSLAATSALGQPAAPSAADATDGDSGELPPLVAPTPTPPPPGPPPSCALLPACGMDGLCTAVDGRCVATADEQCRRSRGCSLGRCTAREGRCVIGSDRDCQQSQPCVIHGLCSAYGDRCMAATDHHCARSRGCQMLGACKAVNGQCLDPEVDDEGMKPRSPGLMYAGIGLTIGGLVTAGVTLPTFFTDSYAVGVIGAPLGATLMVVGIPMWALGATHIPAYTEPSSIGLIAGGCTVAGLGGVGLAIGSVFLGAGEGMGFVPTLLGLAGMGGGVAMAIAGSAPVTPWTRDARIPRLSLSPTSAMLTWQY